jgi:hypothetical protein
MPEQQERQTVSASDQQMRNLAAEAYIYGYPLVLMDLTRQVMTNVAKLGDETAPSNQLCNIRKFPEPTDNAVVSPNADTLYTFSFLDLAREPIILSVPEMGGRYYLMQMLDAWTNVFAAPGTRSTGSGKRDFAITGPSWRETLPSGVHQIKSPTNMVWLIGRAQTNGKNDYAAVHAIQDQYRMVPLSAFGKEYAPPESGAVDPSVDMQTPPVNQVNSLDAADFFNRLNALMAQNCPAPGDAEAIKRFATIGIAPGKPFDLQDLDESNAQQIVGGVRHAQAKIFSEARKQRGKVVNGWEFMTDVGDYGTNYLWRAIVALVGLGANLPEDAVYPRAITDGNGNLLTGENQYEIHFQKGQMPPVNAFWSITLYNDRHFFVPNPIQRYAIGDRDKLKFNNDGSLTIYIQRESPGKEQESNWLPAPAGSFSLFMRLYWPKNEIINGSWKPPKIERMAIADKKVA